MTLSLDLVERLTKSSEDLPFEELVAGNPQLRDRTVILEMADHVNQVAREDMVRAERLANLVAWLAELIADDFCRARAMRCQGNVQVMRNNYREAIEYFDTSLNILLKLGVEQEEAATLSSSLQPLIYLGRYSEAFSKAQRAKNIATGLGDELLLARLEINFGNILHRQDRFLEAVESYCAALRVLTKLGQPRDCAVAYLNVAVCYISLNDFGAAETAYQQAHLLSEKENMPALTAQADYNIAYLHYYRGDYGRAIELYQHTRRYCVRVGDQLHSALCDMDQSEVYLDLHLHEEAIQLGRQAQSAFQDLKMPYEAAKSLVWLGIAAYQSRRSLRAVDLLAEARKQMESEGNRSWTGVLDLYQALLMLQEGRYCEAMRSCKSAQLTFPSHSSKAGHADLVRSTLHLAMGQPADALSAVQRALAVGEKLQSLGILSHGYQLLGKYQEAQNLILDAAASYQRSLEYLEKMPLQLNHDGLKIPYSKNRFELYESMLSLGVAVNTPLAPEAVLDLAEKYKSREIAELVSFRANALQTPSRNRSPLVEKLQSLREELSWYYRQTEDGELKDQKRGDGRGEELRRLIRVREESLLTTLDSIRETEEEFHSIQAASTVSLEKVQQHLEDDELLMEFFEARGTLYVCLLTNLSCKVVPLTRMVLVREQLRRLNAQFARMQVNAAGHSADGPSKQNKTEAVLKTIYEILIEPIQGDIKERRLIIVPEGPLRYVPFHALYDGTHFLTEDYVLSYAGSASLHYLGSIKDAVRGRRDVIVQPKVGVKTLSPELSTFEKVIGLEQLQTVGKPARFIHLDCRLLARLDSPMLSTLIIGQTETSIMDLFNLNLSCSIIGVTGTGSGVRADGDGKELEGFARALLYAGARSLVLPVWDCFEAATSLWFGAFYKRASIASDRAIAFQTTLAEVRDQYPNPFHWAAFTLRGQTGRRNTYGVDETF